MALPQMARSEHIVADYQTVRLSLKGHPMGELRAHFRKERILSCAETAALKDGAFARNAGVVLVRQRPGNGKAIFITIEDETGITNIVLWERTLERFRREVMGARLLLVEGRIQRSPEGVIHLMAQRLADRTADLALLSRVRKPRMDVARADEFAHPQHPRKHPVTFGSCRNRATFIENEICARRGIQKPATEPHPGKRRKSGKSRRHTLALHDLSTKTREASDQMEQGRIPPP